MEIKEIISLLGGVALFLFGMALMGDGLKKVAGNRMELILNRLSGTDIKGIFLGTAVTALIQSSSAASVMVIGFVNSEMMKLRQAVPVIMGAIVGTSITGWIICLSELGGGSAALSLLSTESISALTAIIGILIRILSKKKNQKNVADILLGFSVLMFGMKTMSSAVGGLKDSAELVSFMTGFSNPLLGILAGAVITAVLQSASAAVGVLQALSVTGSITFEIALPVIMGIAIGASVPVLLAGTGASKDGRRTALSYLVIEVSRVLIFAVLFYVIHAIVQFGFFQNTMHMVEIALLNTVFRVLTVCILAPFAGFVVKITRLFIKPNSAEEEKMREINRLQDSFLAFPAIAIEQVKAAVISMAEIAQKSLYAAMAMISDYSEKQFQEVSNLEALCDKYEDKIGNYLSKLTLQPIDDRQNALINQYLRIISDFERMADHAMNVAERAAEIAEKNIQFTESGKKELNNLAEVISKVVSLAITGFLEEDAETAYEVAPLEALVDDLTVLLKNNHTKRLQRGECTIDKGYVFNDLLIDYERISDHCSNIALSVVELKEEQVGAHEISDRIQKEHSDNYEKKYSYYKERYYDDLIQ